MAVAACGSRAPTEPFRVPPCYASIMQAILQYIDRFISLTEEEATAFATLFQHRKLPKLQYFASEGKVEKQIGFLLSGVVRAFYRNQDGIEYNKTFFTSGEFFGAYASLVSKAPNRIFIQALTDCDVLTASYVDFEALFSKYRRIETMARLIAQQFYIEKEKREIELVLLQAAERYKIFREEYPEIEALIPQYHVASYLGITPTQLSRIRARRG